MNWGFGPDFLAARKGDTYHANNGQWWLWVVLFVLVQFVVLSTLQAVFGMIVHGVLFGAMPDFGTVEGEGAARFAKSTIVGLLPSTLLTALFSWWLAGKLNPTGMRGLPLHVPALGAGGWALIIGGFLAVMWVIFLSTFAALGIDPETYSPYGKDAGPNAGLVEKAMSDLADEPLLFALALPGVALAVPMAEEFIFRGALFSMLRQSWFGKTGAVIISAAAWAVVHGGAAPWLFVFVIFIMGLLLGMLLLRFGSLWVTVVVHAVWNGFTSLAILGGTAAG